MAPDKKIHLQVIILLDLLSGDNEDNQKAILYLFFMLEKQNAKIGQRRKCKEIILAVHRISV